MVILVFKQDWEKTDHLSEISPEIIRSMIYIAFPKSKLVSYEMIAGGCANCNIKIILKDMPQSYILRIYIRDKNAPYREQKLGHLLKDILPIPQNYFIGDYETYKFAIFEFMPGITLREYILRGEASQMGDLLQEAGESLSKLQAIRFDSSGFLNNDLFINEPLNILSYISLLNDTLQHSSVKETLSETSIAKLQQMLDTLPDFLSHIEDNQLVHGDFDPSNILVDQVNGKWHITGILDWEFAFSGSMLLDVANMLRYAHEMPPEFETSFLKGIEQGGILLPTDWRNDIAILNILALLDCLERSSPVHHPRRCADIRKLIDHYLEQIKKVSSDK